MSRLGRAHRLVPLVVWGLVLVVTAWLYWPGIDGPPMLDDSASVMVLDELDSNPGYALEYILGDAAGPLGRPVSMATFVLERLYLNEGIRGGKKVNILFHLLIGCLVVWLFALLLKHIRIPGLRWLAVLAGALWLVSPLYVSTVLYVVQRMAMLATLFMVAACISYIYWRGSVQNGRTVLSYTLALLTGLLLVMAVFAKETGIVGVPIVLLMEALWFQFRDANGLVMRRLQVFTLGLIFSGAVSLCLFFTLNLQWLADSYRNRYFTLNERVLTQSRILWDYLGQLLVPDVTRMGLFHDDVAISTSMSEPATTSYALLAWIGVFALSFVLLKWREGRYVVFAIALFLVGHSTESTILSLELYYEHRNYFPGIGVFLAVAVPFGLLFKKWPDTRNAIIAWGWFFVLLLALKTSSQVQIWSSAPLLHLNDVNAHPESFRANVNLAGQLAGVGALDGALEYSARAHQYSRNERKADYDLRDLSLGCTANSPLSEERIAALGLVDPERPLSSVSTLNVLVRQLQNNECPNFNRIALADRMVEIFLDDQCCDEKHDGQPFEEKGAANIYAGLAVLENALERYDNAYQYTERFLLGSPNNVRGLLMKLHFATALNKQGEVQSLLAQLHVLEQAGALTLADSQTLALYKDK